VGLVGYAVTDGVAVLTLNRPPVNALNPELIADIDAAVAEAEAPAVRAVVITGAPHFAAGADITGFQASFEGESEDELAGNLSKVVTRLAGLDKPTIAAVNGFALGGGLELAMGADFRYLAESARAQRLPRLVGYQRALEMCLTGRQVDAAEALDLGIADKVVPDDELLDAAMTDAARYAAGPTAAYAAVKRAFRSGYGTPIDVGLGVEAAEFARVFATADARIGVAAFLAKEKPDFTGT